MTPFFM